MKWDKFKLSDICEVCGGTTPRTNRPEYWDGDITWLSPVDLPEVGSITNVYTSQRKITSIGVKESGLKILPAGSLVFSTRASIGKIGIVQEPLTTNQGFTNLIPNERINVRYLAYVLKKNIPKIEQLGNTTTFKEVSRTAFKNFEIPVPPLHIQQYIADTLDKADALRRNDQELLNKYDELAQAVFYDMFGDPVKNEKGFTTKGLLEIFDITTGKLNSNASVTNGRFPFFTCAKEVYKTDTYSFDTEALLLAGNNASADYDVKHYIGKFDAYQRTYVLTLKNKASYLFYKFQLECRLRDLKKSSKGSNTKYITLGILSEVKMIVPPVNLQLIFESQLININQQVQVLTDENGADILFRSLIDCFF